MSANAALVEQLRWKKFPVLDDGFVCLVDAMGDDQAIVQAARVSYGEGTRQVSDDRSLIRYLMRHRHTTPFEMAEVKLLVRVPMDCWRQWIRHRTASVNEYSTRYSMAIDAAQTTPPEAWRLQAAANRQGSEGFFDAAAGAELSAEEAALQSRPGGSTSSGWSWAWPASRPARTCRCPRTPRPTGRSTCTTCCTSSSCGWTPHAQWEIRQYAATIGHEIVRPLFPLVWEAFVDYRVEALPLRRLEQEVIGPAGRGGAASGRGGRLSGRPDPFGPALTRCRERDECRAKLVRLGLLHQQATKAE